MSSTKIHTSPKLPIETTPRVAWIDATKGIVILLVLITHSDFWNFSTSHEDIRPVLIIRKTFTLAIASFMPIFYVLSGYTFKDKSAILSLRFKRLLTPYGIWGILSLLALFIIPLQDVPHKQQSLCQASIGLLYSKYCLFPSGADNNIHLLPFNASPLWFLTSLFTSFICFLPLVRCKKHTIFLIVLYLILSYLFSFCPILLPWSLDEAFMGALFLYFGYRLRQTQIFTYPIRKPLLLATTLFPIYFLIVYYNGGNNMSIRDYGTIPSFSVFLFFLTVLIGSIIYCTVGIALQRLNLCTPFSHLGRISLILLCSHTFVYYIMDWLYEQNVISLHQLFEKSNLYFVHQITAAIIFSLFVSKITSHLKNTKLTTK